MEIVLCILLLTGFIAVLIYVRDKKLLESVTKLNRGTESERNLVLRLLKAGLPANDIYHDLYLKKNNSDYSQIDLVITTKVGLIVVEVKDYAGWIFGSGGSQQWTQVLAYGKRKYQFYNPIMQNSRHIVELQRQTKHFGEVPFYSLVVFYGDCTFKEITSVPTDTFLIKSWNIIRTIKYILNNNKSVIYTTKESIVEVLRNAVCNGESREIRAQHSANIRKMLSRKFPAR